MDSCPSARVNTANVLQEHQLYSVTNLQVTTASDPGQAHEEHVRSSSASGGRGLWVCGAGFAPPQAKRGFEILSLNIAYMGKK